MSEGAEIDRDGIVDFHNHLMPGVDDGASDREESSAALQHLLEEGVRALITTPHLDASVLVNAERWAQRSAELDAGWEELLSCAATVPGISVQRGAELRLDTPEPDLSDARARLAGGSFALVEFAYFTVPPRSARVLASLRRNGWTPVVAHPERYAGIAADEEVIGEWRAAGAYVQVNGCSLIGRYGVEPRVMAQRILARGWADYLSSDYHARGRADIRAYRKLLEDMDGSEQATLLMEQNPRRLLAGQAPLPVPPLGGERGFWGRLAEVLKK
jgi:protein-tyrosine phosphatase